MYSGRQKCIWICTTRYEISCVIFEARPYGVFSSHINIYFYSYIKVFKEPIPIFIHSLIVIRSSKR